MSKVYIRIKLLLIGLIFSGSIFAQKFVNIACIGNGVTYGIGVENREKNNFPQQLQYLLGANYKVTNFGAVNAPVLSNGVNGYNKNNIWVTCLAFFKCSCFVVSVYPIT